MENKRDFDRPLPKSIRWARSLSDRDLVLILNAALFKAGTRSPKEHVELQYELVHEIKHRFAAFERVPKKSNYEEDDDDYED
jgi:hypothetical protein